MSGLREHSVWFVTPFESDTGRMDAAKIREKLGNFSELAYEPARLAARWSQAFSATDPSVTVKANEIRRIKDRISPQGSVFTDGCGTISPELSRAVWAKLKRVKARCASFRAVPSGIQFRLGVQRVSLYKTLPSMAESFVFDPHKPFGRRGIFATVYNERKGMEWCIEGQVLITRSPQVHPGDVQLVTAVRRPELDHLKNVVVFSCRGARSLQLCLSGGDIDGDDYNIIINPKLHPRFTATPGAYKPLERKRTNRPCTINDVADFVIDFIQTDLLGYISILHLRIADLKGPDCIECMQLAEAASHAVDFPKTGTPANFTSLPRPPSQERPDFLAPESVDSVDNNLYYPSEKLLGILYRNVPSANRPELRYDAFNTPSDGNCIYNALMEIDLSELGLPPLEPPQHDLREEMVQLLEAYSEHLTSIAQVYSISKRGARISEAELISGTIIAKWSDHRMRREAVIAMNSQTHELCTSIRRELRRVSLQDSDSNDNLQIYEDEELEGEPEIDEDELVFEKRAEVFSRVWAAWKVAEDTLTEDAFAFGPQSFGLIALGMLLDLIKDATEDA